jgi:hypothetical protein
MSASQKHATIGTAVSKIAKTNGGQARRAPATPKFTTRWVGDLATLEAVRAEWDELAEDALERSPSSESWMLLPALRHLLSGAVVRVLLVYADSQQSAETPPLLCGVFPLEVMSGYKRLPITVLRAWNHVYSLLPAPLLRAECATDCVRELFRWVRAEWPGSTLVEFPDLRSDSAFFRVLSDVLREDNRVSQVVDVHTRAFFRPRRTAEEYLNAIGTVHHRKEWKRQERRLAEMGQIRFEQITCGAAVDTWLKEFVSLEMEGWKGREGTAFGSRESHRAYLEEVVQTAARRRELMLLGLRLDGKAIALKLNFICGGGGYTFKIAFNEAYSKYSPGVVLELENIRQAHANTAIVWLDSLALPDHPMANRIWLDRATIVTQLVAPGRFSGEFLLGLFPLLRVLKRFLGDGAKG